MENKITCTVEKRFKFYPTLLFEAYQSSKLRVVAIIRNTRSKANFYKSNNETDALIDFRNSSISEIENDKSNLNINIQDISLNEKLLYTDMINLTVNELEFFIQQLTTRMSISFISHQTQFKNDVLYDRSDNSLYAEIYNTLLRYQIISTLNNMPLINNNNNLENKNLIPNKILQILEEKGIISKNHSRWLKSKALLAYFVDVINDKLNLKDSGGRRRIKPFEILFNETGLTNCINEYKNKTGQKPDGYKDIDLIFDNIRV